MVGGNTNYQMTQNAKMRQMVRRGMLITSAEVFYIGEWPECDIAIKSIRTRVEVLTAAASAIVVGHGVLDSGTPGDPNSLVEAGVIADASVEGEADTFTLVDTLKNANIKDAKGYPVVPKGSPIYLTCDATPTAGVIAAIIDFFPLDENAD